MDKIQILADNYPLSSLLEQNDVEEYAVVEWLVEEGHINLSDYFYEDELIEDEE